VLDGLSVERRATGWREWLDSDGARRNLEGLGRIVAESTTWVAESGGRVVGFVNAGPSRDDDASDSTGEIQAIYVIEDVWDTGVGAALMNAAWSWLEGRFECATLWVLEANARARRFYEKGGWRPDGHEQPLDFNGTDLIEVRYRIDLPATGAT
jgi:GNAT superfamily N-acetyltransferase